MLRRLLRPLLAASIPAAAAAARRFSHRVPSLQLFQRAAQRASGKIAIASNGHQYSYRDLLHDSHRLGQRICSALGAAGGDLSEARIAFLTPSTYEYAVAQWATWGAGGVAVPLSSHHPVPELEYYVRDSQASLIVGHSSFTALLKPLAEACSVPYLEISDVAPASAHAPLDVSAPSLDISTMRRAMLIYTSGTTGKPKGVVSTHSMIEAQVNSMVGPWAWTSDDHILNILPLHHVVRQPSISIINV
jgi:malonyl-CoA/methylmalonyl-CoA synthetase